VPTAALDKDIISILLIGADTGSYVLDQNTDVLIVAVINRSAKQVTLLSIPRDLWVNIPGVGYGRINSAHRWGSRLSKGGGPDLLIRTIQENLGIPIDHWIRVDYAGFEGAVDKLGGIEIIVPCRTNLQYRATDPKRSDAVILEPGVYHMDGATALRYVRTRRAETDFDRAHRQQQFLKAVWDQFKSPGIILKLPGLWSAMRPYFATDMNLGVILALAPLALELKRTQIRSRYIGRAETQPWITPEGWSVLLPLPDKIQAAVASLYVPAHAGTEQAGSEAARIQVLNGTQRPYLAEIAADQLKWSGLGIRETGPADRADYEATQIIVFNDKPKTVETLLTQLHLKPEAVIIDPDPSQPFDIQVILGADYDPCLE
jgi:LCP family protein required for cell wall assembly